jgi:hypothetical protein
MWIDSFTSLYTMLTAVHVSFPSTMPCACFRAMSVLHDNRAQLVAIRASDFRIADTL